MRRIVYTRHSDGGVSVCTPTEWAISVMMCGGLWAEHPRGFAEAQIERQIARGVDPDAARRYVRAVQFGGLSEAEAYAVIRDRDCAHLGHTIELMDYDELPDRWFRNAWRQGGNSGRVRVDLHLARPLQWHHIRQAVSAENKKRQESYDPKRLIEPNWDQIRSAIRRASNVEDLRRIWPMDSLHA